jgi:hypothetical protein
MSNDRRRMIEAAKKPTLALDYEIAQEIASALGRLGHALELTLQALAAFDGAHDRDGLTPNEREQRRTLVANAGVALWQFVVQREACGLRDTRQIMRDYGVPTEVQYRMGASVPRSKSPGSQG